MNPSNVTADEIWPDDCPMSPQLGWLTRRRIVLGTLAWLGIFSLGSILVANPFSDERSAAAAIDFWHVMYLHGMLIGLVGITLLLAVSVFQLCWKHACLPSAGAVVVATLLDTIGGIFDTRIPGAEVAMWTQIIGFFALDEMLIVMGLAFFFDWRATRPASRRLSFFVAWAASISMLVAAIMGHLAGWILEFGNHPSVIGLYAKLVAENVGALESNLITSHSHDMVVAWMAMVVATSVAFYAERQPAAEALWLRRLGLGMVLLGTVGFTAIYAWAGFTSWVTPTLFSSAHGVNGLAADDLVTGFAMTGGLLALIGAVLGRKTGPSLPVVAATWSWMLTVGLVVATGYWIEFHETFFGAGDAHAGGAAADAVFTWFHQDIGLMLFPAMTLVMLITARYVLPRGQNAVAAAAIAGSSLLFLAGMIYLFVDKTIHGPGYELATLGLAVMATSFLATIWWGAKERWFAGSRRNAQTGAAMDKAREF